MRDLLEIDLAARGDILCVTLAGELDIAGAARLRDEIDGPLRRGGVRRLLVDLRGLSFMDSTGVRLLLELNGGSAAGGYELVVVRGPRAVQRVLELTGVDSHLALIDSPDQAGFAAASDAG